MSICFHIYIYGIGIRIQSLFTFLFFIFTRNELLILRFYSVITEARPPGQYTIHEFRSYIQTKMFKSPIVNKNKIKYFFIVLNLNCEFIEKLSDGLKRGMDDNNSM